MRLRTFVGLVAVCTIAGGAVTASSASAYQLPEPSSAAPALVTQLPSTPESTTSTSVTPVTVAEATAPCPLDAGSVGGPLPELTADLQSGVAAYAKNVSGASMEAWMDSGGRSGGGVSASAVRTLMRRGLGAGLTDEQVRAFLQPGFLRGISDPSGGARLLDFIGQQDDPAFLGQLAVYAGDLDGREMSWMSAQTAVFDAFPLLRAAYMSQAAAIPPDLDTAGQMLSLANQGYRPAQTTIQAFLAAGNHPSAGAQNSGGVADGMLPVVYDYFTTNYVGPLSPAAAAAVANRDAYNAWVQRIAAWPDAGPLADEGPAPAVFPAPVTSATSTTDLTGKPQPQGADAWTRLPDMEPALHPGAGSVSSGVVRSPPAGLASARDWWGGPMRDRLVACRRPRSRCPS